MRVIRLRSAQDSAIDQTPWYFAFGVLGLALAALLLAQFFLTALHEAPTLAPPGLATLAPDASAAPAPPMLDVDLRDKIKAGEMLEYQMLWKGLPAGEIRLEVPTDCQFQNQTCWKARLDARSNRLVSWFYKISTKARSWIDADGGFTRLYTLSLREEKYRYKERLWFNYALGQQGVRACPESMVAEAAYPTLPLEGRAQDPLSVLYYLRAASIGPRDNPCYIQVAAEWNVWRMRLFKKVIEERAASSNPLEIRLAVAGVGPSEPCYELGLEYWDGETWREGCPFNGLFIRKGQMRVFVHERTGIPVRLLFHGAIGLCEVRLLRPTSDDRPNPFE